MRLSNKSTFSLVCFILILALAFAAMPAMAQVTIEATWSTDRNNDNTANDPGWRITVGGLANDDTIEVTAVVQGGAALASGTDFDAFPAAASDGTTSAGSIPAAIGEVIAVGVRNSTSGSEANYQRVTFPAGGTGATLASTTLALVPKLAELTTPNYYVNFVNNTATVVFDFEAAEADSHGTPSALLHISDVTVTPAANWQIVGVSGTNMVMVRATHATGAASEATIVSLSPASDTASGFALAADAADPVNVPGNGTGRVIFDNMPPTAVFPPADSTASPPVPYPVRPVAIPSDFATPDIDADTVWDEAFYLTVTIDDNSGTDSANAGAELTMANVSVDTSKLTVVQVGEAATQIAGVVGTEYLIHIMPKADRVTTAGEEVTILVTPVDRSGNSGTPARHTVKLAEKLAPVVQPNRAPDFGANTIQNITAQATVTAINVTLPAAVDPDGDTLTYSLTGLPAGLTFTAGTRVLSGTPTAMSAQATYTYTVTDDGTPPMSASLTFMITVSAAPTPPDLNEMETATSSAVITIKPESFVVVVRDMDALNNKGIQFRSDVAANVVEWSTMPDLERLFYTGDQGVILGNGGGGALILKESDAQDADHNRRVGSVGISEIMWGIDKGYRGDETQEKSGQWIELHNLNGMVADNAATMDVDESDDGVAKVYLSWKTGLDITSDSTLTGTLTNPTLDVITNFFDNRPGDKAWDLKGSSGDSRAGEDFVSMARILPDKKSAYANADGARYDNRDGRASGHWEGSGSTYLTARTSDTDAATVYAYKGTPGRVNKASVDVQPDIKDKDATPIPSNNIAINEVANRTDAKYEWIELINKSGGEINLRKYRISMVTGVNKTNKTGTDTLLIDFPNDDKAKVPAGGVFLILASDPADDLDHPIAANGYDVNKAAEEQEPGTPNSPVRYRVLNFQNGGLPDNGNFVLIVRKPDNAAKNDPAELGKDDLDKITDIAGYHPDLKVIGYRNAVSETSLWPLVAFGAPNFTNNRFDKDTVHQRNRLTTADNNARSGVGSGNNKNDQTAFGDRGWTGVGYRRTATQNAMNGGTPGYQNGSLHSNGGAITGPVYISEIMYADDDRGSLPQWIEIRNPSNTLGANLNDWRLTITNHDSINAGPMPNTPGDAWKGKAVASVILRNLEIKPNSAVLITSRKGPRDETYLPADDIFILYPTHRGTFGMTNANSDIINTYGFSIKLEAKAGNAWQLVDEASNLAARRTAGRNERTDTERYDDPRWAWPKANDDDGTRISVVRTNEPGGSKTKGFTRGNGKEQVDWMLSSMDARSDLIATTYYGHISDISTPGQTRGQPLPVNLSFFRPTLEDGKVVIRWTTESELDNAGFNILRSDSRNGEFKQVNDKLIDGKGTTAERSNYKWVDTSAKPGVVYYYQIEDVSFAGERTTLTSTKLKGLISAKNKLTTTWSELKEVQ